MTSDPDTEIRAIQCKLQWIKVLEIKYQSNLLLINTYTSYIDSCHLIGLKVGAWV